VAFRRAAAVLACSGGSFCWGALLFVGRPSRAITTRCRRRRNLGGKLLLLLLLLLLRLLPEAVPVLQPPPPAPPLLLLPEVFKQRPLRFLGGVHLDLGMVVVVVVELVSLLLLLLLLPLLLLEAVLARAEAPPHSLPLLPEVGEQRPHRFFGGHVCWGIFRTPAVAAAGGRGQKQGPRLAKGYLGSAAARAILYS
jgi:hypothetical protein